MFRLMFLLCASMFLVLLIGGEDRGQVRFGLMQKSPEVSASLADPAKLPEAAPVIRASATGPATVPEPAVVVTEAPVVVAAATEPVPVTMPVTVPVPVPVVAEPAPLPVRFVNANSINVRGGPSTNDAVIGRLTRGEAVSVVEEAAEGWLRIRIEGDGIEGYVAARLLSQ